MAMVIARPVKNGGKFEISYWVDNFPYSLQKNSLNAAIYGQFLTKTMEGHEEYVKLPMIRENFWAGWLNYYPLNIFH